MIIVQTDGFDSSLVCTRSMMEILMPKLKLRWEYFEPVKVRSFGCPRMKGTLNVGNDRALKSLARERGIEGARQTVDDAVVYREE